MLLTFINGEKLHMSVKMLYYTTWSFSLLKKREGGFVCHPLV